MGIQRKRDVANPEKFRSPGGEASGPATQEARAHTNRYSMFNGIGNRGFMSTMSLFNQQRPTQPTSPQMPDNSPAINAETETVNTKASENHTNANSQSADNNTAIRDPKQTNPSQNMDLVGDVNSTKKTSGKSAGEAVPADNPVPPDPDIGEPKFSNDSASMPPITIKENPREKSTAESAESGSKMAEKASEQDAPTPQAEVPQAEGITMREPKKSPGQAPSPTPPDNAPRADFVRKTQSSFKLANPKMAPKMNIPKIRMPRMR